ncbi:ABC-2 type transport system permease protein [Amycolatopsis lurida]|uniref:ABC-2 type transport system permease protein n=1 Tax=Amycolatopsis lurida NRRL 2430 TaxID=1460371 RepID=A0A2P2FIY1_AMYLU|nr:hypothetical protein [Amycolatopsis lurida]KFU76674.1 hypothetical protein BB31_35145 [Amycolatopsis lurida NRRL 2430]SEE52538.1 ABC-2 type transport system permease protein [Amycolatopsis lurida]
MAVLLIRMKLAVLRNSMNGRRAGRLVTGAVAGLTLAAGLILLAGRDYPVASLRFDVLGAGFALWTAGWLLGPALFGGGDETLRPEQFSLLPLTPRRLAAGLAASSFVGVGPLVTLVAFSALVVASVKTGLGAAAAVVGLLAVALQLSVCVLASRLITAVLGQVMRSKVGAALAALVSAAILAGLHSSWVLSPLAQTALRTGFPDSFSTWLTALPSGWGLLAVRAAAQGNWPAAAAVLAGLAALGLLCWYGWASLLKRRLATRRASGRPARMSSGDWARGPVTAVVARELRTWSRDLLRFHYLVFALCYALVFCLLPLAVGASIFLPWTGLVFALWVAAISANLYGEDGTELWGKLMVAGAARHDVRGRQLAWLLVTAPATLVLTIAMVVFTGEYSLWPWLATVLPALLGGGAGVTVLVSVLRPVPMTDPRLRGGNLLESGTDFAQVLMVLILSAATAAPAYFAARLGPLWAGPVVGLAGGILLAWLLGRWAAAKLESSAPELLLYLRTGVSPRRKRPAPAWKPQRSSLPKPEPHLEKLGLHLAPNGQRVYVVASLVLCWVPLAAQGIVPALMLTTGQITPSWFLALHLPQHLQWPAVTAMICLGLTMLATGLGIGLHYRAKSRRAAGELEPTTR